MKICRSCEVFYHLIWFMPWPVQTVSNL
jgi:hypothetical protein